MLPVAARSLVTALFITMLVPTSPAHADDRDCGAKKSYRCETQRSGQATQRPKPVESSHPAATREGVPRRSGVSDWLGPQRCLGTGAGDRGQWNRVCFDGPGQTPDADDDQPQVSIHELVDRAAARLPVPAPQVQTAPPRGTRMLVHMPTWFWLASSQGESRSATARTGGVWATVTASAYRITIDPGDGSNPITCSAPGVAYSANADAEDKEGACRHPYAKSGTYTVEVTVDWGADWRSSAETGGTLPTISRSTSFEVTVVEARSELIDNP